eukprot:gene8926-6262_t
MFVIRTPLSCLWHPHLHHSALLLRILGQKHTIELLPALTAENLSQIALPSWGGRQVSTSLAHSGSSSSGALLTGPVYQPDHILHFFHNENAVKESVQEKIVADLSPYLGAVSVADHVLTATEAFLDSFAEPDSPSIERLRRRHAALLDAISCLEETLEVESGDTSFEVPSTTPMSTAVLYPVIRFLVQEGGLLRSAFPNISSTFSHLSTKCRAIQQHDIFVDRSISDYAQSRAAVDDQEGQQVNTGHPFRGFLGDIHQRLSSYSMAFAEEGQKGVVGDGGALKARTSGGHLGLQTIPARLPWTRQRIPLKK